MKKWRGREAVWAGSVCEHVRGPARMRFGLTACLGTHYYSLFFAVLVVSPQNIFPRQIHIKKAMGRLTRSLGWANRISLVTSAIR
jgi:hypothetical protein